VGEERNYLMKFAILNHDGKSHRKFLLPVRPSNFLEWYALTGFSVLLKSALTHYVFLQRGRKGPQRTK